MLNISKNQTFSVVQGKKQYNLWIKIKVDPDKK